MSKSNNKFTKAMNSLKPLIDSIPCKSHISLDICNDFILPSDWGFVNRVNSNYHIAFIKSGNGSYILDGEEIPMGPGRIVFVSSGYYHNRTLDNNKLPRIALLRFSIIDNLSLKPVLNNSKPFAFSYVTKNTARFYELFGLLFEYRISKNNQNYDKLCGLTIIHIIFEIYNDLVNLSSPSYSDSRITRAAKYIEKNLCKKVSTKSLAEISGLTPNYFRILFLKQFGINPKEYQIKLKIQHASQLLSETDLKIKDISDKLGYTDQFSFSKQFKEVTKVCPSQVRKNKMSI
jgi:AraC-like DNA-binding protein